MALNYQFVNDVPEDIKEEVRRRSSVYWPSGHINDNELSWNYQKTSYLILSSYETSTLQPSVPNTNQGPSAAGYTSATAKENSKRWRTEPPQPLPRPEKEIKIQTIRSKIQNPVAPINDLYKENGTISGAILNSAEITSDNTVGRFGAILRITVNFTVFDRYELDSYMDNFLRPGRDIGLEFGWSVDSNINVNKGKIYGTVFNFSFSAKEDGSWDCTLHAYGASAMTYGFPINSKDTSTENPQGVDITNFATYGLLDIIQSSVDFANSIYESEEAIPVKFNCKKIDISEIPSAGFWGQIFPGRKFDRVATENRDREIRAENADPNAPPTGRLPGAAVLTKTIKENIDVYFYKLPTVFIPGIEAKTTINPNFGTSNKSTSTSDSNVTEIIPYISLHNLIKLINSRINKISKRELPNYIFVKDGENVCVGNNYHTFFLQTGPANSSKFGFTTQRNGQGTQSVLSLGGSGEPGDFSNSGNRVTIPLQHLILINTIFIKDELNKIISADKNIQDKKITSFLNTLFSQLNTETGGIINLVLMPEYDRDGNVGDIFILNEHGLPSSVSKITPFSIPMMTRGSVVRSMNIESKVPDAIITEVAVFSRNGLGYGNNDVSITGTGATSSEEVKKGLLSQLFELNSTYMNNLIGTKESSAASIDMWRNKVRDVYRRLFSIEQNLVLNIDGKVQSINNILDLKTATFPIYLKLTLDGINGFLYGNSITTNWLPKQYQDSRIYWTVTNIRHRIENNDWITELEAIYRVKEK